MRIWGSLLLKCNLRLTGLSSRWASNLALKSHSICLNDPVLVWQWPSICWWFSTLWRSCFLSLIYATRCLKCSYSEKCAWSCFVHIIALAFLVIWTVAIGLVVFDLYFICVKVKRFVMILYMLLIGLLEINSRELFDILLAFVRKLCMTIICHLICTVNYLWSSAIRPCLVVTCSSTLDELLHFSHVVNLRLWWSYHKCFAWSIYICIIAATTSLISIV